MSARVKVGVVGVGHMGQFHLNKLMASEFADVVGLYDTDSLRAAHVASNGGSKAFETLEELLFEADAVVVASSTRSHYPITRQALQAGVHVLVEKPIAESPDEARELVRIAEERGLVLQVGLVERFRYLELCGDRRLEPVRFIESHRLSSSLGRERDIDVISDLMIHDLDLTFSLIPEEPCALSAVGLNVITSRCDLASVRIEFPGGAVANLNVSRVTPNPLRKFRVFSESTYASFDLRTNEVDFCSRANVGELSWKKSTKPKLDALQRQADSFLHSIQRGTSPVVSGRDGLRSLVTVQKIREQISMRSEGRISREAMARDLDWEV